MSTTAIYGNAIGNIVAVLYFLLFQAGGLLISFSVLREKNTTEKLLVGSVCGSVMLQWLPLLFAFILDFTVAAHLFGAALMIIISLAVYLKFGKGKMTLTKLNPDFSISFVVIAFTAAIYFVLVLSGLEFRNGEVYSSQATYGDMAMHLGFITSITEQKTFPPQYSILPGNKLGYPFLSDSISSSLYVFGCHLKLAYALPMIFAGLQVFVGAWMLFQKWLKSKGKALIAWVLYFWCGGLGFIYFLPFSGISNFTRIFTEFYETPTNLIDKNIRWVNLIVDMLLPQRATLFGYAVLFTVLYILYEAVFGSDKGKTRNFVLCAVLGGALPMIHTHSFVALALISAVWVLIKLIGEENEIIPKALFGFMLIFFTLYSFVMSGDLRESDINMYVCLIGAFIFALAIVLFVVLYVRKNGIKELASTWGIYLLIVCILALPQLFTWTFNQASSGGFIRGYFNWANLSDNYIWFYLKNMGVVLVAFVIGFFTGKKEDLLTAAPFMLIWFIAELVVFQPNTYDNNKLLYIGYLFVCGIAADLLARVYQKIKSKKAVKYALSAVVMFFCVISAVLTVGRELCAEYCLLDASQVNAAKFIEENTEPTDTVLTDDRHNNAIAVLTGRNIVCGSGSYLYYHGLDYSIQQSDERTMYESPLESMSLYKKYNVSYIEISNYELAAFSVDEEAIASMFELVYSDGETRIYKTGI